MSEGIYFRTSNTQPYHILKAAEWLARIGKVKDATIGYNYLTSLEDNDIKTFKYLMSEYYRVHSFKAGYIVQTSDIGAFRSATGPYGEESHMYY